MKTPFKTVPRLQMLLRWLPASAVGAWAGFLLVGSFAGAPDFRPASRFPSPTRVDLHSRAMAYYRDFSYEIGQPSENCSSGVPMSDFQAERCKKWWSRLATEGCLALAPLLLGAGMLIFGLDFGRATYRRIRRRIVASPYVIKGRVTNPARARGDLYSWFFCFRAVSVELPDRTQARVYFASDAVMPLPGETVGVFKISGRVGPARYAGTIYTPHVAVLAAVS